MALSVDIELVSSSARVTSVKSQQGVSRTDGHPDPTIGPQVYLGPIKRAVYDTELYIIAQYGILHPNVAMLYIWRYLNGAVSHTEILLMAPYINVYYTVPILIFD